MKKPHIRKIKGSPYWSCDGICAEHPVVAYRAWAKYWQLMGFVT